ncbi:unnamed protein product, partial [Amoebophrya sp. A25]
AGQDSHPETAAKKYLLLKVKVRQQGEFLKRTTTTRAVVYLPHRIHLDNLYRGEQLHQFLQCPPPLPQAELLPVRSGGLRGPHQIEAQSSQSQLLELIMRGALVLEDKPA